MRAKTYSELKRSMGEREASQLEDAALLALAGARTPEAMVSLLRMMACLMAAVAHRVEGELDVSELCLSEFANALKVLRTG